MLARSEYLPRHNSVYGDRSCFSKITDQNVKWYHEKWNIGHVSENSQAKLLWDFQFNSRIGNIAITFIITNSKRKFI